MMTTVAAEVVSIDYRKFGTRRKGNMCSMAKIKHVVREK